MSSYHYKLTVDAIQFTTFNHNEECDWMAEQCRTCSDGHCTIGYLSKVKIFIRSQLHLDGIDSTHR